MRRGKKMNTTNHGKVQVSYGPCPPEEFAGRYREKEELRAILSLTIDHGQAVMISGTASSGKTSFLDWAEYEIQNKQDGLNSPTIKIKPITSGMMYTSYKNALTELKGHQKFAWFKNVLNNSKVKTSIDVLLGILEKASPVAGPLGAALGAVIGPVRALFRRASADDINKEIKYDQLLSSFRETLRNLSDKQKNNKILAFLCYDAQRFSELDFQLLKDLVCNLPPRIAFIISFCLTGSNAERHKKLLKVLANFECPEIHLSGMKANEIVEFAKLRYKSSIDDLTAEFLEKKIGDPECLEKCFTLLQRHNRDPSLANVREVLYDAVNPAMSTYIGLNQDWKDRVNSLCVLHLPLPLPLIACMLNIEKTKIARLQDELDLSELFIRVDSESYDFTHRSLREYRRKELASIAKVGYCEQAVECTTVLEDAFSDKMLVDLSLAEYRFCAEEYGSALELNLRLGYQLYDRFDFDLALELTERAKMCAEKTNDRKMLAGALHQKGMILQSIDKIHDSLDAYNKCLDIEREIGYRVGEARTLHQIGMVYEETKDFEKALENYNKSLEIERKGDQVDEAQTLIQIGIVYEKENKVKEAFENYNNGLEIMRVIGDRAGEARTLHQIGMVYEETKDFEKALENYNKSLEIEREMGDQAGEAQTLHQIGVVYEETYEFEKALGNYNNSLNIEREIGYQAGEARTMQQIGIVYQMTNKVKEAFENYNNSLEIMREIGNRAGVARALHQIGMVYEETNEFEKALENYNNSLEIMQEIGDRAGEAGTLHQIGMVYEETNEFEKALGNYNNSLEIEREIGNRTFEAQTLHHIGRVYQETKDFEKALGNYNNSLETKREIGDRAGEARTLHQIGMVYEETKDFEKALGNYNNSLEIMQEIGDRAGEAGTLHQIGMVYEETKGSKEASDYYNRSREIMREIGDRAGVARTLPQIDKDFYRQTDLRGYLKTTLKGGIYGQFL
jgi:tetratricopeptide (TPR) repeat protein